MELQSAEQLTPGHQVVQQLEGDCSQCRAQPAGVLLGGGRSLLFFLRPVSWGTSQASHLPCLAFKFGSKCVNHKMLMLGSTCKSGLGFVSRASASESSNHPSGSPCHDMAPLCHDVWPVRLPACLSGPCIWRAVCLKGLNTFAGNDKSGLDVLSSKH